MVQAKAGCCGNLKGLEPEFPLWPFGPTSQSWSVKEGLGDKKRGSMGRQIGSLSQESIGDDELAVSVPGMRSGTIDHSAKQPAAIPRGDRSQLVVAGASGVAEVLGQRAVTV